jgi:hypothetical protein
VTLLDQYLQAHPPDSPLSTRLPWTEGDTRRLLGEDPRDFTPFFAQLPAASFDHGLLRWLLPELEPSITAWNADGGWKTDWPSQQELIAFASDWLGRLYVFNRASRIRSEFEIARLEPGSGMLVDSGSTFSDFVGTDLIRHKADLLSTDYYEDWLDQGGAQPRPDQCVGYRVPLFLGGEDDIPNLELTDIGVYVSVCGQLYMQVADLPAGTAIDRVQAK